jgi:hypothetical protein
LAADLVRRQVGVIVATGGRGPVQAAKAETATVAFRSCSRWEAMRWPTES